MIPSLLDLYYCDDCNVTFISKDEYDRNMTRIVKGLTKFYSVLNTYENNKVVNNLINDIDHVLNMYGKTNNIDLTPIFEWKRKYFLLMFSNSDNRALYKSMIELIDYMETYKKNRH